MGATYVPVVTLYGDFWSRSLSIREAVDFAETHNVGLMLGRMRKGYLGREMVTLDDLARWIREEDDEAAAFWAAIADGDEAAEMELPR